MFEGLAGRLQEAFARLKSKGKLSEADVDEAMKEVRRALLAADVNFTVVRDFVARVRERAVGQEVMKSLTPAQQVIKIVHDELTSLLGGKPSTLNLSGRPAVVMLVGLQGAGKTTTAGKLAQWVRKQGRRPLLVAADVYRPAAVRQLQTLGEGLKVPVFSLGGDADPVEIAKASLERASQEGCDVVLVDTAGRLHVDDALMEELERMKAAVAPGEILLVVDAMTGQSAVEVAEAFHGRLGLTGAIFTKLDGDTKGGAALSILSVAGCPIKFAGVGEKLDALEPFYPDRMASRILGMGDVLTLIEKAQQTVDAEKAKQLERQLRAGEFSLEDFLDQLRQVRKLGPLDQLLGMLPGMNKIKGLGNLQVDERQLGRVEAIILSMTPEERRRPELIDASRRRRIASGSGTRVEDVGRLLKQFKEMRKMMKQFSSMGKKMARRKGFRPF
ncbi:signal recognition particle protein [Kyrpidia spormannii]|uniref:Signal recognition particle protein n=2 Tax=Kyrpidia spormannii TaxID=2055160 RepID=A0A2K8N6T8_9BACL|nr:MULTISPECIES: signal recognition particle protein [Kyrpidia]ATY85069.1 signal recognition particle protein [Kyrpidia spormannii]MCL6575968.1 signal recognition particle protein [Kyrpidia sp.]CAB3392628.1 signal recognition particle-like (SRP) GTPase [Kyrpidia spormannii]CAB3393546.1 signal recognition particle-like (SRP) GTPase [Kyrpidia spormannii]